MKVPTILISVLLATSLNAYAAPPTEITDQLRTPGEILAHYELLYDSNLKHIIFAQHGNLFLITYARWDGNMWRWTSDDILEVFIAINKKPHILWSRHSPP